MRINNGLPGNGDDDVVEAVILDALLDRVLVGNAAGGRHEIDDDLVRHPHDGVTTHVVVLHVRDRVVGERRQGPLDGRDVVVGGIDEQVDASRRPDEAVQNDREAADQDVADSFRVEGTAEGEEVFEFRCAAERAI